MGADEDDDDAEAGDVGVGEAGTVLLAGAVGDVTVRADDDALAEVVPCCPAAVAAIVEICAAGRDGTGVGVCPVATVRASAVPPETATRPPMTHASTTGRRHSR